MVRQRHFAELRNQYLSLYAADERFRDALGRFYEANVLSMAWYQELLGPSGVPDLDPRLWNHGDDAWTPFRAGSVAEREYWNALDEFCGEWGLDRLGPIPGAEFGSGRDVLHDWCIGKIVYPERGPDDFPTSWVSVDPYPEFDPRVEISVTTVWVPSSESRDAAMTRLVAAATSAIRAELDSVAERAEAAGYTFVDTAPERQRHLEWVYRLAMGGRVVEICDDQHDEDMVRRAVSRIASDLNLSTRGWFRTGRPTSSRRART